jgi:hypothetical protein
VGIQRRATFAEVVDDAVMDVVVVVEFIAVSLE